MHVLVLAGGAGTRFWPASRQSEPKPFVPLMGGQTLFAATLSRLRKLAPPSRTWVVSASELAKVTRSALRGHRGVQLLVEPEGRNTAAAIAWAAARIAAVDPDALVGVFPADHHIPNPDAFVRCAQAAARAARGDKLVLIGIEPRWPDPAYGYIQLGARVRGAAYQVRRFIEKPSPARAQRYLRQGGVLWNAGMVIATAGRILEECRAHASELAPLASVLDATAAGKRVTRVTLARAYRRVQPIAFDHAVLERSPNVLAVRGRFEWSDLGSWDALYDHVPRQGGNRVVGTPPVVSLDSEDNLVWNSTDQSLALVGIKGYVVVNTEDALLVCPKGRAQDVRRIVEELRRKRREDLT